MVVCIFFISEVASVMGIYIFVYGWRRWKGVGSLLMAQRGAPPDTRIYFSPCVRAVFGLLGFCEVRSMSDTEKIATAFPVRGGMRSFSGLQLWM